MPLMSWFYALLSAGLAVGSLVLVFSANGPNVVERWILAVGGVFFGYCAVLIARRAHTRRPVSFDERGLWIHGTTARKLIAWDNIESTSLLSIGSQKMNMIALKNPSLLADQYDDAEARAAVNQENFIAAMATAIGLGAGSADGLAAMFANRRKQYGGEVWVTSHDRDRSAEAFDALLKAWWHKHRKDRP
jgi:hypothetical protein